jgi:GT2 family glycosyltransferase
VIALGSGGEAWERNLDADATLPSLWCLPRFEQLQLHQPGAPEALVAWLNRCQQLGFQLVRLNSSKTPSELLAFRGLETPQPKPQGWLPPQFFRDPISPDQLQPELAWRRAGRPAPEPCQTPTPDSTVVWSHINQAQHASASICISLYNYGERINEALESARAQSHQALELVVVDDHSNDDGPELVQQWLERHRQRFARAVLIRHGQNAGLAAARNTAFKAASTPWCFVLDADNQLLPHAMELCLRIAVDSDAETAVVHPLVEVIAEAGRMDPRCLLAGMSWQNSQFRHGNIVDAMALVRRSAWEAVGGFTHIPGGWEDFDFWCKLIDAGWTGVLCPQRLAIYRSHGQSMLATSSQRQERRLSRLLQARHPWLQLAPADADA